MFPSPCEASTASQTWHLTGIQKACLVEGTHLKAGLKICGALSQPQPSPLGGPEFHRCLASLAEHGWHPGHWQDQC